MKKLTIAIALGGVLSIMPCMADDSASAPGVAISAKASTLGLGAELDYGFNDYWNVRLQLNSFSYDDDFEEDGIDYSGELDLSSVGLLADFRPFAGSFKLTAGLYSNKNAISANAISRADKTFEIGNSRFAGSVNDPLRLNADIELGNSSAGYLGLGFGNSYESGFTMSFDLGVLFSGAAKARLSASGTAYSTSAPAFTFDVNGNSAAAAAFRQQLATEQANLQDDIDDFEIYPVIAVGLGYRF